MELKRRRVFGVALLYSAAAWVAIEVTALAIEAGYLRGWSPRNVWNAAFIGLPLALIVGWFYDITREGIVRTPPSDAGDSLEKSLQRKDYVLLPSLAAVWTILYVLIHIPPAVDKSIAALPFENRGHDPANAPFAFGIHNDVLKQLQQLSDIKVIAQPSVESIDKNLSVAEMGRHEGPPSVQKGPISKR